MDDTDNAFSIPNILDIFKLLAGDDFSSDVCDEWVLLAYIESTSMTWEQFLEMPPAAQDMLVPASIKHDIDSDRLVWEVGWEEQYEAIAKLVQDDLFLIRMSCLYDMSEDDVLALFDKALEVWELYNKKLEAVLAEYLEAAPSVEDDASGGNETRTD